jgi:hypothetical protein
MSGKGYTGYLTAKQRSKQPLPRLAYSMLQRWYESDPRDEKLLASLSFRYIFQYLKDGSTKRDRLDVALADIGYTLQEIKGKTSDDIATEVLQRGVQIDSDDSD